MGRRMMRALGAGLMEAGNQAQISRKEELELKRQQNLKNIADGRQGLMKEQMQLTREGQMQQQVPAMKNWRFFAQDHCSVS